MFCPTCQGDYPESWKVCPKDASELLESSRIGKYTITATLGVGGMGTVYRALNPDTRGEVAIKVMHADAAETESARARFKREAAAVAKLKTSHVVKVYDFGAEADGTLYLVMELLDGHTLRDEIHAPPDQMELARAQYIIDGVLKGLSAAHKSGIVHRDLKPENIFIANTDDGEIPQILDFGIARIEGPNGATRSGAVTRPGTVMGTAVYMPPEQLQGLVSKVGSWSDVYSIGAILYEMLAGTTQVKAGSLAEVLIQVRRGNLPPLTQLRPDLPPALADVVLRCLEAEPTKRLQNADEVRAALAGVWGATTSGAQPVAKPRRAQSNVAATKVSDDPVDPTVDTVPARPAGVAAIATTVPSQEAPAIADAPIAPPAQRAPNRTAIWVAVVIVVAILAIAIAFGVR